MCSWLSPTITNTTFLFKATDYFSHMLLQRWEAKIRRPRSIRKMKMVIWHGKNVDYALLLDRREKLSGLSYGRSLLPYCIAFPYKVHWMVFYAAFNTILVKPGRQLTLFMSFLGFTSTRLGLWSVLPKETSWKPRGSSSARTQEPWLMSRTFYHWATRDPFLYKINA